MKRLPAPPPPANDDDTTRLPLVPVPGRGGGRALAVLLEIEDPRDGAIWVALDAYGAVAGSGFVSGTIH